MRRVKAVSLVVALAYIGIVGLTITQSNLRANAFEGDKEPDKSITTISETTLKSFGNTEEPKLLEVLGTEHGNQKSIKWNNAMFIHVAKLFSDNARKEARAEIEAAKADSTKATEEIRELLKLEEEAKIAEEKKKLFQLTEVKWDIPSGLGRLHTYTEWDTFNWAYDCRNVIEELGGQCKQQGGQITYSPEGFVKYGNWYAGAMTSTFGKAGDMILIVQENDTVFPVIIADHKCQTYTSYDHNPANKYGHHNGACMVEFEVTKNNTIYNGSGGYAGAQFDHYIKQVINVGNVYNNKDYIEDAEKVFRSSSVNHMTFIPVP